MSKSHSVTMINDEACHALVVTTANKTQLFISTEIFTMSLFEEKKNYN